LGDHRGDTSQRDLGLNPLQNFAQELKIALSRDMDASTRFINSFSTLSRLRTSCQ